MFLDINFVIPILILYYLVNDRNRNFQTKPMQKQFRFGFGSVILTETETADLPIFEHFVGEMDFRK